MSLTQFGGQVGSVLTWIGVDGLRGRKATTGNDLESLL